MKASYPRPLWPYILFVALALMLLTLSSVARAQGAAPCLAFPSVAEALAGKYQEQPVAAGMVNEGAVVVLFAAERGETWTLVVRQANGRTCFVASGTGWSERQTVANGKEG